MGQILESCEEEDQDSVHKTATLPMTKHMAAAAKMTGYVNCSSGKTTSHTSLQKFLFSVSSLNFPSLDVASYSLDYLYSSYDSHNLSLIVDDG